MSPVSPTARINLSATRRESTKIEKRGSVHGGEIFINKLTLAARHLNKTDFCRNKNNLENEIQTSMLAETKKANKLATTRFDNKNGKLATVMDIDRPKLKWMMFPSTLENTFRKRNAPPSELGAIPNWKPVRIASHSEWEPFRMAMLC